MAERMSAAYNVDAFKLDREIGMWPRQICHGSTSFRATVRGRDGQVSSVRISDAVPYTL